MKYRLPSKHKPWIRWLTVWFASFAAVVVLVPVLLVQTEPDPPAPGSSEMPSPQGAERGAQQQLIVPVYLDKEKRVEQVPLEDYVRGVVAAEMPIEFEPEALKAQAMAARTYIIHRSLNPDAGSQAASNAWVTDTVAHQAYVTDSELKNRWPAESFERNMDKLRRAVRETEGLILTYEDQPIEAVFFSTSNGYTENSEDYWGTYYPYLRSVPSPWDAGLSPRFKETAVFSNRELQRKLGLNGIVPVSSGASKGLKVLGLTASGRVKSVSVGGKTFSGREFREKLGLNSAHFQWEWRGDELHITTTGYGHGVGMSQYGANGMAREGSKAEDIVKHYYTGVKISKL